MAQGSMSAPCRVGGFWSQQILDQALRAIGALIPMTAPLGPIASIRQARVHFLFKRPSMFGHQAALMRSFRQAEVRLPISRPLAQLIITLLSIHRRPSTRKTTAFLGQRWQMIAFRSIRRAAIRRLRCLMPRQIPRPPARHSRKVGR